jgi:hypothetical protein
LFIIKTVCHKPVNVLLKFNKPDAYSFFICFLPHFCAAMFNKLQKKWKVTGVQLALIICTFAIGGSATGYVAKKIMNALSIGQDWLWAIVYILLITILWPLAVIIISIPFGQFRFFSRYIKKIGEKMGLMSAEDGSQKSEKS